MNRAVCVPRSDYPCSMNSHKSILIVDDDQVFREALVRAFIRREYHTSQAGTLAQAITQYDEHQPAYAVVDLRIGDESGLKVVEELVQRNADLRILILTGYASVATAVAAIKLGAVHYLSKPVEVEEIIGALEKQSVTADTRIPDKPMSVRRLEWEHIQKVLVEHNGNISAAARALGMHRRSLQRKLQKRPAKS